MRAEVLDELDRILEREGEPDDILRDVVWALADSSDIVWAGIAFLDEGTLSLGPSAGEPDPSQRVSVPVIFQGSRVGELWVDGEVERTLLERVADRLSGHVLIGWDTGGETWDP